MADTIGRISELEGFEKLSLQHSDDKQGKQIENILTREEEQLFCSDTWLKNRGNPQLPIFKADLDFMQHVLPVVREACLSLKKTRVDTVDIVNLIQDEDSRMTLFHLAFCLSRINKFLRSMEDLKLVWIDKCPELFGGIASTASSKVTNKKIVGDWKFSAKLEELNACEKEAISIKMDGILVILKEVLSNMGIHPQVAGSENKSAELMYLVEDGTSKLTTAAGKLDLLLARKFDSVSKSFAPDSEEHDLGLKSDGLREDEACEMHRDVTNSLLYITEEIPGIYKLKFRKLREVISPWNMWGFLNLDRKSKD